MNKSSLNYILNPIRTGGSQQGSTRWKLGETKMKIIKRIEDEYEELICGFISELKRQGVSGREIGIRLAQIIEIFKEWEDK